MDDVLRSVARYYGDKLRAFGATARGVDWNSEASQQLRFTQLLRLLEQGEPFSILDYGCGYGALLDELARRALACDYVGFDVAEEMVQEAVRRHGESEGRRFSARAQDLAPVDYVVASGIFNVKVDAEEETWRAHVAATLDRFHALSRRGFAFNCLTLFSDPERRRPDLHYADPHALFDHCRERFSPRVALLHDYPLWEFTILVRKEEER